MQRRDLLECCKCFALSPTEVYGRSRVRVCSKEASLSAASAWVPLAHTKLAERLRVRVCSEGTSLSTASAWAPLAQIELY